MAQNYRVTDQTRMLDIGANGVPTEVWEIKFETIPSGIPSYEKIPVAIYTPAHVLEVLTKAAADIEAVHAGEAE